MPWSDVLVFLLVYLVVPSGAYLLLSLIVHEQEKHYDGRDDETDN